MILVEQFEIDPLKWGTDISTYFLTGKGHWAKVAGASVSISFFSDMAGEVEIKHRVRTGNSTNPTEYISSYNVVVNGVVVPMILDTTKPNEKRPEFGGSHIGYIKGKLLFKEGENTYSLTATKQYGAIENWMEIIAPTVGFSQDQLDAYAKQKADEAVKLATTGMVTTQSLNDAILKAAADQKAKDQLAIASFKL